eukprot:2767826-Rhodomonas_salina.1
MSQSAPIRGAPWCGIARNLPQFLARRELKRHYFVKTSKISFDCLSAACGTRAAELHALLAARGRRRSN